MIMFIFSSKGFISRGVTLAQLVKASVGQADVQRFDPHLGHNLLSFGVSCKVQALWAPSGTNHKAKLAISLKTNDRPCNDRKRVARSLYKRGVFTKSIPEEMRTILFQV